MAITKRTYPSGKTAWFVDWYDASGKRCRKAFPTKKQAEDAQAKFKTQRFEEKVMGVSKTPKFYFSELITKFLKYSELNKKRRTHSTNLIRIKHLNDFLGNCLLDDINSLKIEDYKLWRISFVSPSTVNRELAVLRHIVKMGKEWGMTNIDIKIKMLKEPPGSLRFLSLEEINSLLLELPNSPDYLQIIVMIALNTGMRKGEILALQWTNVNLENMLIHVVESIDEKGNRDTCKDNHRRDLPMNETLFEVLSKYKLTASSENLFPVLEVKNSFKGLLKRAEITNFRFHDLRHTFASYLVMEGTDIATVSKLMGHSTLEMTMRYSHLSPDHRKKAVEKISHLLDTCLFSHQVESLDSKSLSDNT